MGPLSSYREWLARIVFRKKKKLKSGGEKHARKSNFWECVRYFGGMATQTMHPLDTSWQVVIALEAYYMVHDHDGLVVRFNKICHLLFRQNSVLKSLICNIQKHSAKTIFLSTHKKVHCNKAMNWGTLCIAQQSLAYILLCHWHRPGTFRSNIKVRNKQNKMYRPDRHAC